MVMLPPDVSTIHIHNLPVQAAREQAVTAGDLALLQEFCKHRNWNPAATAPKQFFRVSCGTSVQRRNQSINLSIKQSIPYFSQGWQILVSWTTSRTQAT